MGRKRNQGKAKRAAKAKAKAKQEAAAEERNNNQTTASDGQSLAVQIQRMQIGTGNTIQCQHGADNLPFEGIPFQFAKAFIKECFESTRGVDRSIWDSLITTQNATMDEFADVWNDFAHMETAVSYFLFVGAQCILKGDYQDARENAIYARFLEQHIAVNLKKNQALLNIPKIEEMWISNDVHTLVKFFRHRIPCSCLNEKYEEVKDTAKMGLCYNLECQYPYGEVERSKTWYCSRCKCVTYCSRKCQVADFARHKMLCDEVAAKTAEFNADATHQKGGNCIP